MVARDLLHVSVTILIILLFPIFSIPIHSHARVRKEGRGSFVAILEWVLGDRKRGKYYDQYRQREKHIISNTHIA